MEIPAGFFNVSFNKAMAFGYRTEDVDEFVTRALHIIKEQQEENEVLGRKLEVLASSLENYREEEDSLRSALIGAQKLGDSILKDSRQKAQKILLDAEEHAAQITAAAETAVDKQQYELEKVQVEAAGFKEKLFALYRTHLDIIKNIPAEYDREEKPRGKAPSVAQPVDPEPTQGQEGREELSGPRHDDQSPAAYAPGYSAPPLEKQTTAPKEVYPQKGTYPEQPRPNPEPAPQEEEDYFESPFVVEEPDSDKPFTSPQPYQDSASYDQEAYNEEPYDQEPTPPQSYEEAPYDNHSFTQQLEEPGQYGEGEPGYTPRQPYDDQLEPPVASQQQEDDIAVYHAPPRRREEQNPFATPPMVQLEFDTGSYDEYEEDEFAAEKKLLREGNLNRIPYLDDDDEDDFAVPLTSKKKPVVSQKFGVLKFGDAFDLRDD